VRLVLKEKQSDIEFAIRAKFPPYANFNSSTCMATAEDGSRTQYLDTSRKEWWRGVFGQEYTAVDGLALVKDERLRTLVASRVRVR
jgi:hypothetical protein